MDARFSKTIESKLRSPSRGLFAQNPIWRPIWPPPKKVWLLFALKLCVIPLFQCFGGKDSIYDVNFVGWESLKGAKIWVKHRRTTSYYLKSYLIFIYHQISINATNDIHFGPSNCSNSLSNYPTSPSNCTISFSNSSNSPSNCPNSPANCHNSSLHCHISSSTCTNSLSNRSNSP